MKSILLAVCLVILNLNLILSQTPTKPLWPDQFDVVFGLNAPAGTNDSYPAIVNASSHFYYDWNYNGSSVIVYDQHCLPGIFPYSYDMRCSLYFNNIGAYIYFPAIAMCCLAFPGVGSVPPDFLRGFNYSGYDQIAFDYFGVPHLTNFWIGGSGFMYWTALNKYQSDIALDDGGGLLWNFAPFNVESQDPSMFVLPHSYCNIGCPSAGAMAVNTDALKQDPMFKLSMEHKSATAEQFKKPYLAYKPMSY